MPIRISSGAEIWNEFVGSTGLDRANAVALFDQHDVIDTLSHDEAEDIGVEIDSLVGIRSYLCSYGKRHRQDSNDDRNSWGVFVAEMDGMIFTDHRQAHERYRNQVIIYRSDWMNNTCIGVTGDKGQVAELMNKPVLLFDDKESNIQLLRDRSTPQFFLDGIVVCRGHKSGRHVSPGFGIGHDAHQWPEIIRRFDHLHGLGHGYEVHGDRTAGSAYR